ncbi:MAG: GNAT family N-acetyltransferase, partial [Gluconacetobacter sp.]
MEPLSFEIRHAGCLAEIADDLARLRITVFREWPYLYDGADPLYERQYLEVYLRSPQAAAIVARDGGGRIVGASTC